MRLVDVPPILKEALAVHEAFRRLAFTPDEIFISPSKEKVHVMVIRGAHRFAVCVGENTIPLVQFEDVWMAATSAWNTGVALEQRAIFENSLVRRDAVGLVMALIDKGFSIRSDA